ncbi:MAG TPA: aspartate carbamoyltransferase, partial [Permianibacter sp.]|nr:aspartate carbamoyltransferase [Permianibacter sp.]
MNLLGSHILSVQQFDRANIESLFQVADTMRPYARREKMTTVLNGAILGSLFFEPSTRTRVSFGCAFNLLGGEVRETVGIESSSL